MLGAFNDHTYSLSLALDARRALKALTAFQRDGVRDDRLKNAVTDAVESLKALNSGSPLFANLSVASSYQSYEQIQTLQEVQGSLSDNRLTEKLERLIADTPCEGLDESVKSAILFFTAVENSALQKYNQSIGSGI